MFAKHYARFYDSLYQSKPYKQEVDFVYDWGGKPKTILDIGAGTASYWQYFPKETKIVGLDMSVKMIGQSEHKDKICMGNAADMGHNHALGGLISKITGRVHVDTAMALFDVINYIPAHNWWEHIPVKKGGYFIFDVWDASKARYDGFKITTKRVGNITRTIYPLFLGNQVNLTIVIEEGDKTYTEHHTMYLYDEKDIRQFCGDEFEVVGKWETKSWQTFFKLRKI